MPYYAGFMPGIVSLLREATSPDLTVLRGKAMECAGLIGEAVGVQVFAADAMEIMQLFMSALVRHFCFFFEDKHVALYFLLLCTLCTYVRIYFLLFTIPVCSKWILSVILRLIIFFLHVRVCLVH